MKMKELLLNFITLFLIFLISVLVFNFSWFLWLIIYFLAISFLVKKYKTEELKKENKEEEKGIFYEVKNEIYHYNNTDIRVTNILNKSELDFYKKLKIFLEWKDYFIFSKVRLADFLNLNNIKNFSERTTIFNKVSRKHIDFLITDYNSRILFLIELDWEVHKYDKKSKENDKFKDDLFNKLWLKLFRFRVNNNYNFSVLNTDIFLYSKDYLDKFKKEA